MDNYRALKAIRGAARFQQSDLTSEDVIRMRVQALYTTSSVLVLKQADLEQLATACAGAIIDRGRKLPAKPLAYYFARKAGLVRIRAGYRDPGQTERGIRTLLDSTDVVPKGAIFFVGVSDALFEQLWDRAAAAESSSASSASQDPTDGTDQLRILLDQDTRLQVPEALKQEFIGNSEEADGVRKRILLATRVDHPILIEGETGTGKEVVARMIHKCSDRPAESFFPVNCGGIPGELLESELFGHVKGAFTGALRDKPGLWTLATAGTLFLDEIGDLSALHQVKVLRALEDGRYRALGGEQEIQSGARIIAATNRDLWHMVETGKFREDLFYRVFAFRIRTPALRDHPEDIADLADHFWRKLTEDQYTPLPSEVIAELKAYRWPGNARELRAFLINVCMVADSRPVTAPMVRAVMRERLGPGFPPEEVPTPRQGRTAARDSVKPTRPC